MSTRFTKTVPVMRTLMLGGLAVAATALVALAPSSRAEEAAEAKPAAEKHAAAKTAKARKPAAPPAQNPAAPGEPGLLPFTPAEVTASPPGAIDITSDETMEWHNDQLAAVARGHVIVTRGEDTLHCDTLVVYYRKANDGSTEMYRMAADGQVVMTSPSQQAFGDHGVYDVDQDVTVLTGDHLHLVTRSDTVYARDTLEYWKQQQLLVARGNAIAINDKGDRIRADVLVGIMEENAAKQLEMTRMDAKGNVLIVTPKDVARGSEGTYNVKTRIAILTGDVKLTQGQNQVNGHRAEVNNATGVSRMLPDETVKGGRVHSVLIPKKSDQPAAPAPAAPPAGGANPPGGGAQP
ncbi:lipopolysaccharide export system protein LptA [Nitrospirillum amazonense]|uniref:Lipopolysaccharide export system protein LptA n=1 Tax=Nitrospirillum amazonense TaxID=28077 RepID=A0A560FMI5_9PROT|nr:LptA/OstA family protein [Nitrospirillum amazonense]TWB22761.1 lipopolysaccharide export system protein LptA [Nitrospirillum amazonense]